MKILHIGDVHLGSRLQNNSRNGELEKVFKFLVEMVKEEKIEAVLFAGDVFDNGRPSTESQELYYSFLLRLYKEGCKQVVVIAGNHDYSEFLEAPKGILKEMNIHVIGKAVPDNLAQEVIPVGNAGFPDAIVCAVPYLHHGDVMGLLPDGESGESRDEAFDMGVAEHYRRVFDIADKMRGGRNIPIIGMGHLYAKGSTFATKDSRRSVGSLQSINIDDFGAGFDYMALGHIHKPQSVCGHDNWRYAGSLLPMTIQENPYVTQVVMIDTSDIAHPQGIELPDSCFHKMALIKGDMDELRKQLKELREKGDDIWVKAVYAGEENLLNWSIDLSLEMRESCVQIVDTAIQRPTPAETRTIDDAHEMSLANLSPLDVFNNYLDKKTDVPEEQRKSLRELFEQSMKKVYDPSQTVEKAAREVAGVMKFKRLYIKNVNSLYGENLIDFEDGAFGDGIFLISGKTGSGKSSILDAICLALYGCTPRVKVITANRDSVMSDGQNEMCAELTFSIGNDVYRASFHHKRTINAKEPFQATEHLLAKNGQQLPIKNTEVRKKIIELIGLDDGQFTRCVLLAQGSFDAFLKSGISERSNILKKITGTDVYSKIAAQICEDYKREDEQFKLDSKFLEDGDKPLEQNELDALLKSCEDVSKELERIQADLDNCNKTEQLFNDIEDGEKKLEEAEMALDAAKKAMDDAKPMFEQLTAARRAQNCEQNYNDWKKQADECKRIESEISKLAHAQKDLEESLEKANEERRIKKDAVDVLNARLAESEVLFKEVRALDVQIKGIASLLTKAEDEFETAKKVKQSAEDTFAIAASLWNEHQNKARESTDYLKWHSGDELLAQKMEAWEVRRAELLKNERTLAKERDGIAQESASLNKKKTQMEEVRRTLDASERDLSGLQEKIFNEQATLVELLDGKSREDIQNAWAAAGKLDEFFSGEVQRKEFLRPGTPCPLCGSVEHPYCEGAEVPKESDYAKTASDLKKRLKDIDDCNKRLTELANAKGKEEAKKAAASSSFQNFAEQIKADEERLSIRNANLASAQKELEARANALVDELRQALQIEWTDHSSLPTELQLRIDAYSNAKAEVDAMSKAKEEYEKALSAYNAVAVQNASNVTIKDNELNGLKNKLTSLDASRKAIFGTDDVDKREQKLKKELKDGQSAYETAATNTVKVETELKNNKEMLYELGKKASLAMPELAKLEAALKEAVAANGFTGVDDFSAKRMQPSAMQKLDDELTKLKSGVIGNQATCVERKGALDILREKMPENVDRQANLDAIEECKKLQLDNNEKLTELKIKLANDKANREKREEALKKLEERRVIYNNWKYLNDNLGEGDRFGRIAQGYTFRELLSFANRNRLTSLKSHFTLINDDDDPLELNVIDHYRGDRIRTSRNLSGGESFEVSLALALGLADMSAMSQKASLGNVLLDEGFGTLDDDSLNSALELLMQLKNSDRKLVGIISHVGKLREKINAQIEVTNNVGMGMISGAGVKSMSDVRRQFKSDHPEEAALMEEAAEKARRKEVEAAEKERRKA